MGVLISSRRGTFPTVEINGLKARGAFVPDEGDLTVDCRAGSNLSRKTLSFSFLKMRWWPRDAYAALVAILGLSSCHDFNFHFLGILWLHEQCGVYGPGPRISEKETLARLRIRRARRFSNTRRPKLRILMLDSAGIACTSFKSCC